MKTQYAELGDESLKWLRESAENANRIQKELLLSLLENNKDTIYGKKYGFEEISSLSMYQQRVPLTDYEDYDAYIQEMLSGAEGVLTALAPVYYCISSGSTGGPKYLPVSEEDLWVHYYSNYGAVFGMVREYYSNLLPEQIFGKIFQIGEFVKTYTDRGVMNGIRSCAIYPWMDKDGEFDASDYCVPKEVLFPEALEDLLYIKVRFALAEPEITAVHGAFIHHVVSVFSYIDEKWDLLLKDMELGTVDESIPMSNSWRKKVQAWLPPNPTRAAELRRLDRENLADHMIQKLWKNMRYIMAIGGRSLERYTEKYASYAADIPTHYSAYGASEGAMGVANGVAQRDAYILLPRAGFFEFLPQNNTSGEKGSSPLFCDQVQVGETYEVVFTNLSGLYRYRIKDIIRIEGFYGETPIVSFCYRKNLLLNISDEKTNTEQLESAVRQFEKNSGLHITGYCVQEDYSLSPGRYLCYLECIGTVDTDMAKEFDLCLCHANYGYAGCRNFNQIAPAKLLCLKEGAFVRYKDMQASKGYEMSQSKPIRVLFDHESQGFFQMEVQGQGEEKAHEKGR